MGSGAGFWLNLVEAAGVVGLLIWSILAHVSHRNTQRITDNAVKLVEQGKALTRLEEKMKSAPGDADLQRIHDRISEGNTARQKLAVQVGKLESGVSRLESSVGRIEDHLLSRNGES